MSMCLGHQTISSNNWVRLRNYFPVFGTLVLMVMPASGQQGRQATSAAEPGKAPESISKSSGVESPNVAPTERDSYYGKHASAIPNKLIAERATWSTETKFASVSNSTDTAQTKPAEHDDTSELTKKLSNPVSSLISFPIQTNFDFHMGTGSGWRNTTNVQPVIPIALNKDWNLISRTIIPIIYQANVTAPGASEFGIGDIVQSIFISPNKTEPFIWGAGPAILVPSATNTFLGSKQLGVGPTVVVLKQQHGWTVGTLWNHIWRVAGGSGRPRVNSDFVQPFLNYSTKDGWTYGVNTESTYDWTGNHWAVPIHFTIQKVVRFGKQPIQFTGGMRCWATSPSGGPEGCGLRIAVTALFPKKPK